MHISVFIVNVFLASPVSTEAKGDIDSRSVYVGNVSYFLQFFIQFLCVDKISISVIIIWVTCSGSSRETKILKISKTEGSDT